MPPIIDDRTTNRNWEKPNADNDLADDAVRLASALDTMDGELVVSDPAGVTGADKITNMMSLTQAEYDAIGTPNASTLYYII